jgi:hypothetical protein
VQFYKLLGQCTFYSGAFATSNNEGCFAGQDNFLLSEMYSAKFRSKI